MRPGGRIKEEGFNSSLVKSAYKSRSKVYPLTATRKMWHFAARQLAANFGLYFAMYN